MSRASSSSLKRKRKKNSKKRNIKLRKIDKRERKMLVSKRSITVLKPSLDSFPLTPPPKTWKKITTTSTQITS